MADRANIRSSSAPPNRRRGPGRPPRDAGPQLTRDKVLEAGLHMIEQSGTSSLSIRKLATHLGVAPNTLYWYVTDKDDLMLGIVERAFGEISIPPTSPGPWSERARELCRWLRRKLLENPEIVATPAFRATFPFALLPFVYEIGKILENAGYEGEDLVEATFIIFYHTMGFVLMEVGRQTYGIAKRSTRSVLAHAKEHLAEPRVDQATELLKTAKQIDLDATFENSLDALLQGMKAKRR